MKTYGPWFNHQGFQDAAAGYLPRGSRIRWSGLVPEGFLSGYWTEAQIKENLARRGLDVEDLTSVYDSLSWDLVPLFRVWLTVVTPVDWNERDAFGVIAREVQTAAGVAASDTKGEVLLKPAGTDSTGEPVYSAAPGNAPGGAGAGIIESLSKAIGTTQQTGQLILLAGVGILAVVLLKRK